jgi:hypothetical protein
MKTIKPVEITTIRKYEFLSDANEKFTLELPFPVENYELITKGNKFALSVVNYDNDGYGAFESVFESDDWNLVSLGKKKPDRWETLYITDEGRDAFINTFKDEKSKDVLMELISVGDDLETIEDALPHETYENFITWIYQSSAINRGYFEVQPFIREISMMEHSGVHVKLESSISSPEDISQFWGVIAPTWTLILEGCIESKLITKEIATELKDDKAIRLKWIEVTKEKDVEWFKKFYYGYLSKCIESKFKGIKASYDGDIFWVTSVVGSFTKNEDGTIVIDNSEHGESIFGFYDFKDAEEYIKHENELQLKV